MTFKQAQLVEDLCIEDAELANPMPTLVLELEMPENHEHSDLEVSEDHEELSPEEEFNIIVDELPGAPAGTKDPELTVEEEKDKNDVREKKDKWSPPSNPEKFLVWVKERLDGVPKHSGYDVAGIDRAIAYLQRLNSEISKAMRGDLDGALDSNKIEELRVQIEEGCERLEDRLEKVKASKKSKKKADASYGLVKEGQKAVGVQGIYVTVPLLISRLARILINGHISAGHDMEDMYKKLVEKYKLDMREQAELQQLLQDMNFPLRQDRGMNPGEEMDPTSSDNFDFAALYPA